ncbi:hypothetical protein BpHYR1_001536, partial [Brachionus plicatilis]
KKYKKIYDFQDLFLTFFLTFIQVCYELSIKRARSAYEDNSRNLLIQLVKQGYNFNKISDKNLLVKPNYYSKKCYQTNCNICQFSCEMQKILNIPIINYNFLLNITLKNYSFMILKKAILVETHRLIK